MNTLSQKQMKAARFGWILYDWASSPVPTLHATFVFAVYFTTVIMPEGGSTVWAWMTGSAALLVALAAVCWSGRPRQLSSGGPRQIAGPFC
jgi:MFS-type transporter involved in bile tolerance (Atg22 family)